MESFKNSISQELQAFSLQFELAMKSDVGLLDVILTYLTKNKGKQLRPVFVLLCAGIAGTINQSSYRAALFVEILHTSSLVHDDLIDDSSKRRGRFSVNALWKNRAAVFTGDHLFTKSVLLLLNQGDYTLLKIFADSVEKVIEGELLQMDKSRKINLDEAVYFKIIKGKTATLLASACAAGAASTNQDPAFINQFYQFGESAGIAFQIKDDLLDYSNDDTGKPVGNDIKEKKVTLPLLYTLNHCDPIIQKQLIKALKKGQPDDIVLIKNEIQKHGGFAYAEQKMTEYKEQAISIISQFPASPLRKSLEDLIAYLTNRSY